MQLTYAKILKLFTLKKINNKTDGMLHIINYLTQNFVRESDHFRNLKPQESN